MTFNKAPWAIDGARSTSALARLATYATGGGQSGIVKPADLRVLALAVPGNGLRIASGNAMILNRYLANPDEMYVTANPGTHTVPSQSMPAASPQTRYFLVCVVVGDTEFNQTGHPYMPTTIAPELREDFEYVRVVLVPCTSSTKRVEELNLPYPAYALARLEIPPNTTTIQQSMIVDVRKLSQARFTSESLMSVPTPGQNLTSGTWANWINFIPYIDVPIWATYVTVTATLSGIVALTTGGQQALGGMRAVFGGVPGAELSYDVDTIDGRRDTYVVSLGIPVGSMAGTSQPLQMQGYKDTNFAGYLTTYPGCQIVYDVKFYENVT